MFEYEGFQYTLDEVTKAAENEKISVDGLSLIHI